MAPLPTRLSRLGRFAPSSLAGLGFDLRLLGTEAPLELLARQSDEISKSVAELLERIDTVVAVGDRSARSLALDGIEALIEEAPRVLSGRDARRVLAHLYEIRGPLVEEAGELTVRQQRLVQKRRAIAAARRAHQSADPKSLDAIAGAIHHEIFEVISTGVDVSNVFHSLILFEKRAIQALLRSMPISDFDVWKPVYQRLGALNELSRKARELKRAGGIDDVPIDEFRKLVRPEASLIKGQILETWFWHSDIWKEWSNELYVKALARAKQLSRMGAEFEVRVIMQPLRVLDTGGEIYDGAIVIVRQHGADSGHFVGYLDAVVQIKAERNISVIRQIGRDLDRENVLGRLILRTDQGAVFDLTKATGRADPVRMIVAPELPQAARFGDLPAGVDLKFAPALLDAEQLDAVAFALLRAILKKKLRN